MGQGLCRGSPACLRMAGFDGKVGQRALTVFTLVGLSLNTMSLTSVHGCVVTCGQI